MQSDPVLTGSEHALRVVEFERVLSLVARECVSGLGAERVRAAEPRDDLALIELEQRRVNGARALLDAPASWAVATIPDARSSLARLAVQGSVLDGAELLDILHLLEASRIARRQLSGDDIAQLARDVLAEYRDALLDNPDLTRELRRCIGDDGSVLDGASPLLKRIRRELASMSERIIALLEKIAARLEPHQRVPDVSVTVREGRYVLAVRREARGSVGGIVHASSASGATLFVEPPAAVEQGNRKRELEADERREVERILRELSDAARPHHADLERALDALVTLDSLFARAHFARSFRCGTCTATPAEHGFSIVDGRHPLLVDQGISVVPFTLSMAPNERTLLISGPNTGGKTVLLKSVALFSAMLQAGIPAPVGDGSRVPVFDGFYADLGDEQSIQASLSTFSAHLRNISDILARATRSSLVLMDEIGSGTDPVEGAALAAAVLEELTTRGVTTLATTHLGALRELALEVNGIVNASLQFDSARLSPTYQFVKGIPGRSFGLSIASMLGLPKAIVERAEERVPRGERDVARLLQDMEQRERELRARELDSKARAGELLLRAEQIEGRERTLREGERSFERESRSAARRHLLDARAEVERTIRELRGHGADALESAGRAARRHIEQLAAEHDAHLRELEEGGRETTAPPPNRPVALGDLVGVDSLGGREGTVVDLRGESAVVAVGVMKLTLPLSGLRAVSARPRPLEAPSIRGELPEEHVSSEIDVRGMRADEVERVVIPAIDSAARADFRSLRIIHGKGTGALRAKVHEILSRDEQVESFRDGAWNEGGTGATIVVLR